MTKCCFASSYKYNVDVYFFRKFLYIFCVYSLPLTQGITVSVVNLTADIVPSTYTPSTWETCRPYITLSNDVYPNNGSTFIPLPYETNDRYIQSTRYSIVTTQAYTNALIGSRNETVYYKCHTIRYTSPLIHQIDGKVTVRIDHGRNFPAYDAYALSSPSVLPYNESIGLRIKLHPSALPLAEFELFFLHSLPLPLESASPYIYTVPYTVPLMDSITHYFSHPSGPANTSGYLASTASWIYSTNLTNFSSISSYSSDYIPPEFVISATSFLYNPYARSNVTDALPNGLAEILNWNVSSAESSMDTLFIDTSSYDEQNRLLNAGSNRTTNTTRSIVVSPTYSVYNRTALLSCCPGLAYQYASYPLTSDNSVPCCWYHPEPSQGPNVGKLRIVHSSVQVTTTGQLNTSVTLEWNLQTIKYNTSGKDILDFEIVWYDKYVRNYVGNRSLVLDIRSDMQGTIIHGNPLSMTSPTVLTQPWYYLIEPIPNDLFTKRWMRYNTTFYGVPVGIPQTYGVRVRYIEGQVGSWLWIKYTLPRKLNQPPSWNISAYPSNQFRSYYDIDNVPPLVSGFYKHLPYTINVTEAMENYLPYYPNFTFTFQNISKYIMDDYTPSSAFYVTIQPVYESSSRSDRSSAATLYPTLYRNYGYVNETFLYGTFIGNVSGSAKDAYFTYIPLPNASLFTKEEEIIHRVKFTVWDTGVPKSVWVGNSTSIATNDPLLFRNYDTRIAEPPKAWSFYIYFTYTDTYRNLPCPPYYFRNGTHCEPCLICSIGTYLSRSCTDVPRNRIEYVSPVCLPCPDYTLLYPLRSYYPLTQISIPSTCPLPWYLAENRTSFCTICNPLNETELSPCEPTKDTVCGPKVSTASVVRYDQCTVDGNGTVDNKAVTIASVCGAPGYNDTSCTVLAEGYWKSLVHTHPLPCRCGKGTIPSLSLMVNSVLPSTVPLCRNDTGECLCQRNYRSPYCDNCLPGYYGESCNLTCTCTTEHSRCNDGLYGNGQCLCDDGWIGKNCSVPIDKHLYYASPNRSDNQRSLIGSMIMEPFVMYENIPFTYDIPLESVYLVVNGTVRYITCNDTLESNRSGITLSLNEGPEWLRLVRTSTVCRLQGIPQRHLLYNNYIYTVKHNRDNGLEMGVLSITYRGGAVEEALPIPLLFSVRIDNHPPELNVSSSLLSSVGSASSLSSPLIYVPGEIFTLNLTERWGYLPFSTFPVPLREGIITDPDIGYNVDENITLTIEPRIDWLTITYEYEIIPTIDYVDKGTILGTNISKALLRGVHKIEGIVPWKFTSFSTANYSQTVTLTLRDAQGLTNRFNFTLLIVTTGRADYVPFQFNNSVELLLALSSVEVYVDDWFAYPLSIVPSLYDTRKDDFSFSYQARLTDACSPIDIRLSVYEDIMSSVPILTNIYYGSASWLHFALSDPARTPPLTLVPFELLLYGIPTTLDYRRSRYWNITITVIGTCGYEITHNVSILLLPALSPPVPTITTLPLIEIVPHEIFTNTALNYSPWNFTVNSLDTLFAYPNYFLSTPDTSMMSSTLQPSSVHYILTGPKNRTLPGNIGMNCSTPFQCVIGTRESVSIPYPDLFGYYVFELRAYRYLEDNRLSVPLYIPVHIHGCPRNEYYLYASSNRATTTSTITYLTYLQNFDYVSNPYQVCGGRGKCRSDQNICDCYTGYTGVSCNRCAPLYMPIALTDGNDTATTVVNTSLRTNFKCVPVPQSDIDAAIQGATAELLLSNRLGTLLPAETYPVERAYLDSLAVQVDRLRSESSGSSSSNWSFEEGSPLFIVILCLIGSLFSGLCAFAWSICLGKCGSISRSVPNQRTGTTTVSSPLTATKSVNPSAAAATGLTLRTLATEERKNGSVTSIETNGKENASFESVTDEATVPKDRSIEPSSIEPSSLSTVTKPEALPTSVPILHRLSRLHSISRAERGSRGTRFSELIEEEDLFAISPTPTVHAETSPTIDIQELTISDKSISSSSTSSIIHSPNHLRHRRKQPLSSRGSTMSRGSVTEIIEHEPVTANEEK